MEYQSSRRIEFMYYFLRYSLILLGLNYSLYADNNSTVDYFSEPIKKKKSCNVVIDIGHSPINYGATSATGITEYDFNRQFANVLYEHLRAMDIGVAFTNQDELEITLEERANDVNRMQPDLMISIHHDTVLKRFLKQWKYKGKKLTYCDAFKGYSIYVSKDNPRFLASLMLAVNIGDKLYKKGLRPNLTHAMKLMGENRKFVDSRLGIYKYDDLILLKNSNVPAVLLQVGVIINRNEEQLLNEKNYINAYSKLVAEGIKNTCIRLNTR